MSNILGGVHMIHILLINANPIVSRLLALCTREDTVLLEEVQTLSSVQRKHYDIVFIDEASYSDEMITLKKHISSRQKILLTHETKQVPSFDEILLKPFLPFQIIDIIDQIQPLEVAEEEIDHTPIPKETEKDVANIHIFNAHEIDQHTPSLEEAEKAPIEEPTKTHIFTLDTSEEEAQKAQILDEDEIEKIKRLLEMNDTEALFPTETLSETEIEERKIEVIKEQLVSDGLEIVEESEMIESFDPPKIYIDLEKDTHMPMVKTKQQNKYTKKERKLLKRIVRLTIQHLSNKKIKKLLKGKKVKLTIQTEQQ